MGRRTSAAQHEPSEQHTEYALVKELRLMRTEMSKITAVVSNLERKVDTLQIELDNVSDENKLIRRHLANQLGVFDNMAFTTEQVAEIISGFYQSIKLRKKINRRIVTDNWINNGLMRVVKESGKFRVTGFEIKRFLKEELEYITPENATKRGSIQQKVNNYFL